MVCVFDQKEDTQIGTLFSVSILTEKYKQSVCKVFAVLLPNQAVKWTCSNFRTSMELKGIDKLSGETTLSKGL